METTSNESHYKTYCLQVKAEIFGGFFPGDKSTELRRILNQYEPRGAIKGGCVGPLEADFNIDSDKLDSLVADMIASNAIQAFEITPTEQSPELMTHLRNLQIALKNKYGDRYINVFTREDIHYFGKYASRIHQIRQEMFAEYFRGNWRGGFEEPEDKDPPKGWI